MVDPKFRIFLLSVFFLQSNPERGTLTKDSSTYTNLCRFDLTVQDELDPCFGFLQGFACFLAQRYSQIGTLQAGPSRS